MPDLEVVKTAEELAAESAARAAETEQAAASAAAESETPPDKSDGEGEPPKKGGVQRRIDELTRERRLAEAEVEFWKAKAIGGGNGKEAPKETAPVAKAKPNPADFETTEAYLDARDEWVRDETLRTVDEKLQKSEQAREQKTQAEILTDEWIERESAAEEKHTDYADVTAQAMGSLDKLKGPGKAAIADAIQFVEAGPELLYFFGQHPEELRKVTELPPRQAMLELGRIEARLAQPDSGGEEKPPHPKVPKPPTPIRKSSATEKLDPDNPEDAEKMGDEWYAARDAKLRGR